MAEGDRTFTQEELDKIVEERLAREKKRFEQEKKDLERKHGETLEEYEERIKNANLTAEEKHKKALEKIQKDLDAKNAELNTIRTNEMKRAALSKSKLPETFLSRIHGNTEEEIAASVKELQEVLGGYVKSIAGGVPGEMNGGSKGKGSVTKEQFEKMDYSERIELFNTNKELYDALTK